MSGSTFQTNKIFLQELLKACHEGRIQLPDFQRSWVWDEERIKSLIASISRAFPVGALMTLETGGTLNFKPRSIEGAPDAIKPELAKELLLDGQQRMTSLYQVALRGKVVRTRTPKNKLVDRWFYLDIRKCLDPSADREEAIVGVPADRILRTDFNREIVLDLSSDVKEFENLMFPISEVFGWADWQNRFGNKIARERFMELWPVLSEFYQTVVLNFERYQVPVISLGSQTSKEAVCTVFEKVNTGGKPLDAFELVTAMYAADNHELRRDWYGKDGEPGRAHRFKMELKPGNRDAGVLAGVSNTDFLQAVCLFHRRDLRRKAEAEGKQGKELPQVAPKREVLLDLPLEAYLEWQALAEKGFVAAGRFVYELRIYDNANLPYQSQLVALAAILADLGDRAANKTVRDKLVQWYWCGVFGELYGSSSEGRIARDFLEVPAWIDGGETPSTVREAIFRADRLDTMRSRLSAAYLGLNALLMKGAARDWLSGKEMDHVDFFGESIDIHHIFPKDWCKRQGIEAKSFDSIVNKTPLGYRTNRIIGGDAPSNYLAKLEKGGATNAPIAPAELDELLASHLIEPGSLRSNSYWEFVAARKAKLLALIEQAMGKRAHSEAGGEIVEDVSDDEDVEATQTMDVQAVAAQ